MNTYSISVTDSGMVAETGDWATDNAAGRQLAARALQLMREREAPFLLGHLAKSMVERGRHGGIEVGFWHAIAEAAL